MFTAWFYDCFCVLFFLEKQLLSQEGRSRECHHHAYTPLFQGRSCLQFLYLYVFFKKFSSFQHIKQNERSTKKLVGALYCRVTEHLTVSLTLWMEGRGAFRSVVELILKEEMWCFISISPIHADNFSWNFNIMHFKSVLTISICIYIWGMGIGDKISLQIDLSCKVQERSISRFVALFFSFLKII